MRVGSTHLIALVVFLTTVRAGDAQMVSAADAPLLRCQRACPAVLPADPLTSCYNTPRPCVVGSAWFDVAILTRSTADSQFVLFSNTINNPVLNVEDLGFEAQVGFHAGFVLSSDCGCDVQFNYSGVHDMESAETVDANGLFFVFYGGVPVNPATAYRVDYTSSLDLFELNVRSRQWKRLAPLVGLRFGGLVEEFSILDATDSSTGVWSKTENVMFGVQFGVEALLCEVGRVRLETSVKAGAFHNDASVWARAADPVGTDIELNRDFFHMAFLGEAHLLWVYQFGKCFSARLGYQALWLEGVGLAPDQSDNFRIATGEGTFDIGSAFYQGGYAGFEITW